MTGSPLSGIPKKSRRQMNVTIEIPEDRAARFLKQAQACGLTVDRWLLELAEQNAAVLPGQAPPERTLANVCAKVRGLADDLDFSRDSSPGRDVVL
jgi:hypothetical protein